MLLSTRIAVQYSTKTSVVRDWRVVNVPSEDSTTISVATLFSRILDHVYDPLEPFEPTSADRIAPIRAAVGSSQKGDFQDLPLTVRVADVLTFGVYLKFFIIREDTALSCCSISSSSKNVTEVSFSPSKDIASST